MNGQMAEEELSELLAPLPFPYPPLPRAAFESFSPEDLRLPEAPTEIMRMSNATFQATRAVHSIIRLPHLLNKLLETPTEIFPLGVRAPRETE